MLGTGAQTAVKSHTWRIVVSWICWQRAQHCSQCTTFYRLRVLRKRLAFSFTPPRQFQSIAFPATQRVKCLAVRQLRSPLSNWASGYAIALQGAMNQKKCRPFEAALTGGVFTRPHEVTTPEGYGVVSHKDRRMLVRARQESSWNCKQFSSAERGHPYRSRISEHLRWLLNKSAPDVGKKMPLVGGTQ
ncbi:hypothetical protein BamMEX5DRAFT_2678 [Burkholderia ambifaria MEX-5]|uniref:Uncharacterized protein n=1 Tax=Burkholderia ambifaria MEX-5 TaxID=396597 RepID=B1T4G2_9BURK|nr:hypothetical protein BamMEX5DRAFT_2678 [Burkholderia ambifaria MEX-5]